MPAIGGVGLMIGGPRRLVAAPLPGGRRVLGVHAQAPMRLEHRSIHAFVPGFTPAAKVVAQVAKRVRQGGTHSEDFIGPAEPLVRKGRTEPERRPAQRKVAPVYRRVQRQRAGQEQRRRAARKPPLSGAACPRPQQQRRPKQVGRGFRHPGQAETHSCPEQIGRSP